MTSCATIFVDCWPCGTCGYVVPAGPCADDCPELLAYCEACEDGPHGPYTFVRPTEQWQFQMSEKP